MTSKDLDKSLIDYLKQIPDERSSGGRRHHERLLRIPRFGQICRTASSSINRNA